MNPPMDKRNKESIFYDRLKSSLTSYLARELFYFLFTIKPSSHQSSLGYK